MSWAPRRARVRAASGKNQSKQIITPMVVPQAAKTGKPEVAGVEDQLLVPEEVHLAVDLVRAVGAHQDRAVVDAVAGALGEAGDQGRAAGGGEFAQTPAGRAVRERLGERQGLGAVDELVAGGEELRQHREVADGGHQGQRGLDVAADLAEDGIGLDDGGADDHRGHLAGLGQGDQAVEGLAAVEVLDDARAPLPAQCRGAGRDRATGEVRAAARAAASSGGTSRPVVPCGHDLRQAARVGGHHRQAAGGGLGGGEAEALAARRQHGDAAAGPEGGDVLDEPGEVRPAPGGAGRRASARSRRRSAPSPARRSRGGPGRRSASIRCQAAISACRPLRAMSWPTKPTTGGRAATSSRGWNRCEVDALVEQVHAGRVEPRRAGAGRCGGSPRC